MTVQAFGMTGENKVWLACLSCYNEGRLEGGWFDADALEQWLDDHTNDYYEGGMMLCSYHIAEIDECHNCEAPSPASCTRHVRWTGDEWAIHNYDGGIEHLALSEHPDLRELIELMRTLDGDSERNTGAAMLVKGITGEMPTASQVESVAERMYVIDDISVWAEENAYDLGYGKQLDALPHYISCTINWEHVGENQVRYDMYDIEYRGNIYALYNDEGVDA